MWKVAVLGLGFLVYAAPGRADGIYQWTDAKGGVHYSNTSGGGDRDAPGTRDEASEQAAVGGAAGVDDAGAFSTDASLRRNALERDFRTTDRHLHELEARLATLARARTGNSRGSASTGGIGTLAVDVRSEEEKALTAERDQIAKHAHDIRAEYGKLREEVTARLGTTPEWWVDVRFDRR